MLSFSLLVLTLCILSGAAQDSVNAGLKPFSLSASIDFKLEDDGAMALETYAIKYIATFNKCAVRLSDKYGEVRLETIRFNEADKDSDGGDDQSATVTRVATFLGVCTACLDANGEFLQNGALLASFAMPCGRATALGTQVSKIVTTFPTQQALQSMADMKKVDHKEMEREKLHKDSDRAKEIHSAVKRAIQTQKTTSHRYLR